MHNSEFITEYKNFLSEYGKYIKIFKIYKYQTEMFYERGYKLDKVNTNYKLVRRYNRNIIRYENNTLREKMDMLRGFIELYGLEDSIIENINDNIYLTPNGVPVKTFLILPTIDDRKEIKDIGKDDLSYINSFVENNSDYKYIFVPLLKLSNQAKRILNQIQKSNANVQIFQSNLMLSNPTKHFLSPRFHLLNDVEKDDLTEFLSKKDDPLPLKKLQNMKLDDPIAMYYDAKVGDVFEVISDIFVAGSVVSTNKYYRYVIE